MNANDKEDSLTLGILEAIENDDGVTQRHLADKLGVALGLANSYLKRCVRKGLVKIHQAPANRYLYYLTPQGFTEKSRLTAEYLISSFEFYRKAGNSYRDVFNTAQNMGWEKVLFCGISEITEIASLRIDEFNLEHIASYEFEFESKEFLGKPVWMSLENNIEDIDACVITSLNAPNQMFEQTILQIDESRVLVPKFLGLSR